MNSTANNTTETRQRAASKEQRQADVLEVMWQLGWRLADRSRLWLARDNDDAAKQLGMVSGHLRAVIRQLEAAGRIVKLQRGLWQVKNPRQPAASQTA